MVGKETHGSEEQSIQENAHYRLAILKDEILERWLARVRVELPASKYHMNAALMDSIPDFLDRLILSLEKGALYLNGVGEEHGRHRAMMKEYDLEQIITEYQIMSEIILQTMEEVYPISNESRDLILNSISDSIKQAAITFVNLNLLREEQNQRKLKVQLESARVLGEFDSLEKAIPQILRLICEGLNWSIGIFWEVDEGNNTLQCVQKWFDPNLIFIDLEGISDNVMLSQGEGLPGYVWKTKASKWIQNIRGDQDFVKSRNIAQEGMKSAFGFPITIDKKVIGVLEFLGKETIQADEELLSLMAVLGVQIGQFIKRKQGELSIFEEVRRRSAVMEVSLDSIITIASDGRIIEFNPAAEKTFDYKREEVLGKELAALIIPENLRERHRQGMVRYLKTREARILRKRLEFNAFKKDGSELMVEVAVLEVPNSNPPIFTGFLRDITEKKIAEKALKESEDLFRTYTEGMPQKAYMADSEGNIIYFNQRYYQYTGLNPSQLEGWNWTHSGTIHPDDIHRVMENWLDSLETGKTYECELRVRNVQGEFRWHLSRAVPVRNEFGKIIKWVGIETDIEDQKVNLLNLEQEKAIREQFVATLTHDLRNPLNTIKSNANLILKFPERAEVRERSMARILAGIERADRMIRNLLDANLIQAGKSIPIKKTECELVTMTEDIIEELKYTYGERFKLKSTRAIYGNWSSEGVRRIIENLLSNACKYGDAESNVSITLSDDQKVAKIEVQNCGKTIALEDQKTLFESFRRSKTAEQSGKKGWGLGLFLVKGITEAHGGEVSVTSNLQEGTNFTVKLPLR